MWRKKRDTPPRYEEVSLEETVENDMFLEPIPSSKVVEEKKKTVTFAELKRERAEIVARIKKAKEEERRRKLEEEFEDFCELITVSTNPHDMKQKILTEEDTDGSYFLVKKDRNPEHLIKRWNDEYSKSGMTLISNPKKKMRPSGLEFISHYSVRVKYSDSYEFPCD